MCSRHFMCEQTFSSAEKQFEYIWAKKKPNVKKLVCYITVVLQKLWFKWSFTGVYGDLVWSKSFFFKENLNWSLKIDVKIKLAKKCPNLHIRKHNFISHTNGGNPVNRFNIFTLTLKHFSLTFSDKICAAHNVRNSGWP